MSLVKPAIVFSDEPGFAGRVTGGSALRRALLANCRETSHAMYVPFISFFRKNDADLKDFPPMSPYDACVYLYGQKYAAKEWKRVQAELGEAVAS